MAEFTIGNSISFGWDKMKENFVLYLLILLTIIGIEIVGNALGKIDYIGWIFLVAMFVAISLIKLGVFSVGLNIVDGKPAKYKQLMSQPGMLWNYILASIVFIVCFAVGLILLIVPGIMFALRYQFYGFAMVDKQLGPIEALKESARITKGHSWRLLGFFFTCVGVILLGVLCLLVGVLAALPVVEIAAAFVYRALSANAPAAAVTPIAPAAPVEPTPVAAAPVAAPAKKVAKKTPKKKVAAKKKQ